MVVDNRFLGSFLGYKEGKQCFPFLIVTALLFDKKIVFIGPATVRMVSNSGPPMPMPMQVPPGHMVQQIVDENGILTHVILSPQIPGVPTSPLMVSCAILLAVI